MLSHFALSLLLRFDLIDFDLVHNITCIHRHRFWADGDKIESSRTVYGDETCTITTSPSYIIYVKHIRSPRERERERERAHII